MTGRRFWPSLEDATLDCPEIGRCYLCFTLHEMTELATVQVEGPQQWVLVCEECRELEVSR